MPVVVDDTFTGSSLDAAWTRHGITSARETWLSPGLRDSSLAATEGYTRPSPTSGDFVVTLDFSIASASGFMRGPWILDSSGNGVGACWYTVPSALILCSISAYGYSGSFTQIGTGQTSGLIRITKTGASYTAAYSTNGGSTWTSETPALTPPPFTPTVYGMGNWFSTGSDAITFREFTATTPSPDATLTPAPARSTAGATAPILSAGSTLLAPAARASAGAVGPEMSVANITTLAPAPATALAGAVSPGFVEVIAAGTDTTNAAGGLSLVGGGTVTLTVPVAALPPTLTLAHRVDKAIAYPAPTMVDGRPT